MDPLIETAARALAAGDAFTALKRIALRDDADALALRGIAMAQLGERTRARELLRSAARAFGTQAPLNRSRCLLAEAEIALVSRDPGSPVRSLQALRATLQVLGDQANAAHAGYLEARRLLLLGRLGEAERVLDGIDGTTLTGASRVGCELVTAGIAMRRIRTAPARAALARADGMARAFGNAALLAEVGRAARALEVPAARLLQQGKEQMLRLDQVETQLASGALVVDACRYTVRAGHAIVSLNRRPALFALARALARAWPGEVPREALLYRLFRARHADESHRVRLRVEVGRLRQALQPLAELHATRRGFALQPRASRPVAVLAPPVESDHAHLLALLHDGEAWSSSALALALDVSARTVQRALAVLRESGDAEAFGRGRARRWMATSVPGFPTSLLLPVLESDALECLHE